MLLGQQTVIAGYVSSAVNHTPVLGSQGVGDENLPANTVKLVELFGRGMRSSDEQLLI